MCCIANLLVYSKWPNSASSGLVGDAFPVSLISVLSFHLWSLSSMVLVPYHGHSCLRLEVLLDHWVLWCDHILTRVHPLPVFRVVLFLEAAETKRFINTLLMFS